MHSHIVLFSECDVFRLIYIKQSVSPESEPWLVGGFLCSMNDKLPSINMTDAPLNFSICQVTCKCYQIYSKYNSSPFIHIKCFCLKPLHIQHFNLELWLKVLASELQCLGFKS